MDLEEGAACAPARGAGNIDDLRRNIYDASPRRTNADELSERIVSQDLSLYAVYEAPADLYIPADYVALFSDTTPDAVRGVGLLIADGQLVGIDQQCAFAPDELAEFLGLDEALLVPDSR